VIASGKRPADRSDVLSDSCKIPLYGGAGLMGYTSESLFEDKKIVTGRVGTLGRVHLAYPPCWASDNVLVLSPRDKTFFSFSYQWLCGIDVHALNRGSTQPLLTQKDLGAQMAVIPRRTVLEKFEEISAALNQQIRLQTLQIETLTNLRDTLLPRLISGELRANLIAGVAA
jgi:type I restriction enzyme S subunit